MCYHSLHQRTSIHISGNPVAVDNTVYDIVVFLNAWIYRNVTNTFSWQGKVFTSDDGGVKGWANPTV